MQLHMQVRAVRVFWYHCGSPHTLVWVQVQHHMHGDIRSRHTHLDRQGCVNVCGVVFRLRARQAMEVFSTYIAH